MFRDTDVPTPLWLFMAPFLPSAVEHDRHIAAADGVLRDPLCLFQILANSLHSSTMELLGNTMKCLLMHRFWQADDRTKSRKLVMSCTYGTRCQNSLHVCGEAIVRATAVRANVRAGITALAGRVDPLRCMRRLKYRLRALSIVTT